MSAVVKTATQYQVVLLSIVVAGRDAVLKLGLIVGKWGGVLLLPLPLSVVVVVPLATEVVLRRCTTGFFATAMDQSISNRRAYRY